MNFLKSFIVTFKNLASGKFTIQYPEEKIQKPYRARWKHILQRYENGLERCIACMLCAGACPTDAIYIEGDENPPENPYSHGERYAKIFDIDYGRCILCGYCIEACPTEALAMTDFSDFAFLSRDNMILRKEDLLVSEKGISKAVWMGYYRKGDIKGGARITFNPSGYPMYRKEIK